MHTTVASCIGRILFCDCIRPLFPPSTTLKSCAPLDYFKHNSNHRYLGCAPNVLINCKACTQSVLCWLIGDYLNKFVKTCCDWSNIQIPAKSVTCLGQNWSIEGGHNEYYWYLTLHLLFWVFWQFWRLSVECILYGFVFEVGGMILEIMGDCVLEKAEKFEIKFQYLWPIQMDCWNPLGYNKTTLFL